MRKTLASSSSHPSPSHLQAIRSSLRHHVLAALPPDVRIAPRSKRNALIRHHVGKLVTLSHRLLQTPASVSAIPNLLTHTLPQLAALYSRASDAATVSTITRQVLPVFEAVASLGEPALLPSLLVAALLISVGVHDGRSSDRLITFLLRLFKSFPPSSHHPPWHPTDYLSIADTVSLTLLLRWPSSQPPSHATQSLHALLRNLHSHTPLPLFALSAGLCYAALPSSSEAHNRNPPHVTVLTAALSPSQNPPPFSSICTATPNSAVHPTHTTPLTLVLLTSAAGPAFIQQLPPSIAAPIAHALRTLIEAICPTSPPIHPTSPFAARLAASIARNPAPLATALAITSSIAGTTHAAISSLAHAVTAKPNVLTSDSTAVASASTSPSSSFSTTSMAVRLATAFSSFAIADVAPTAVAALLDLLALCMSVSSSASLTGVVSQTVHYIIEHIADSRRSITSFVIANIAAPVCAVVCVDLPHNVDVLTSRAVSLLTITAAFLASTKNAPARGIPISRTSDVGDEDSIAEDDGYDGDAEHRWLSVAQQLTALLEDHNALKSNAFATAAVKLLAAITSRHEAVLQPARTHTVTDAIPSLLKLLHTAMGRNRQPPRRDITLLLTMVDAIASNIINRPLLSHTLHTMTDMCTNERDTPFERMVYLLLLRFMVRCDMTVIDLPMQNLVRVVGPSPSAERHSSMMRAARTAVLGAEMGRTNVCVQWLLRTFNSSHDNEGEEARRSKL